MLVSLLLCLPHPLSTPSSPSVALACVRTHSPLDFKDYSPPLADNSTAVIDVPAALAGDLQRLGPFPLPGMDVEADGFTRAAMVA
jgi:hypothetical protein